LLIYSPHDESKIEKTSSTEETGRNVRILIHDRPGYAFPAQLSRRLAARGHTVLHSYGAFFQGPKGEVIKRADDSPLLDFEGLQLKRPFHKYSFIKRLFQELEYSQLVLQQIHAFSPDIVFFANTPSEAQALIYWQCRHLDIPLVYWLQDVYGVALQKLLGKRFKLLGRFVGAFYKSLDRYLLRQSDYIILITEDFQPFLQEWGIAKHKACVIPNWSPLESIPVRPKTNDWSLQHDLADKFCLLYSGTLGMKHNPALLLQLALQLRQESEVRVVVISEGLGAKWLQEQKAAHKVKNLVLLGYQPFDQVADVLGTADILLAILEPDAGIFSVPSKVLSYLCAARPLLLAVPPENLAAQIVAKQKAGLIVPPAQTDEFVNKAKQLIANDALREEMSRNGRSYAESHFDIEQITDQFEAIIHKLVK
jgi:glycosyltransferase involved in cell wall biosynthesis